MPGTFSHGQGHETVYPQMVAGWLGMPIDKVRLVQGDTDQVAAGRGTYASRSMMVGGSALRAAADEVIEKGKKWAAHFMEASPTDITFADGKFTIAGTDKEMPLMKVAAMSFIPVGIPAELGVGLTGAGAFSANVPSFPNGCHICEVELDGDTGTVEIDRYTVVDDIGTVINPLLAEGQIHGGVVQGVGQALLEDIIHDENGSFLTGSLMDYGIPRADNMPAIQRRLQPGGVEVEPAGRQGRGRGRHRRLDADGDERGPRCAAELRCGRCADAGDAATHLGRDQRQPAQSGGITDRSGGEPSAERLRLDPSVLVELQIDLDLLGRGMELAVDQDVVETSA